MRGASAVLTLTLRLLVVSIYLSMNCISDQVVLYRGRGYSNSFIPCRGVLRHTRSHHLSSLHDVYSATFKRKPNVGVGHSLPKHSSLKSRFIAYSGSIRRESGRGFHIRPRTMCAGFPRHQTGDSVHRATSLPHHSPPLGQRCPRPPAYYKHQKLRATPGQRTRVVKKPRGSIGFGPNVW